MSLQGSFKDFHIADLLQLIGIHQKTGLLSLESSDEALTLLLRNGEVVGLQSDRPPLERAVADGLVARGVLTAARLGAALIQQREQPQSLGALLTADGAVPRKEWEAGLAREVGNRLYRPFRWTSGTYRFTPQEAVDPGEGSLPPLGVDALLMEGMRRADEWPLILQDVPTPATVFKVGSGQGKLNPRDIQATDVAMLKLVDGKRTAAELVTLSGLGEFEAWSGLSNLVRANAIGAVGSVPGPAGAAPAAAARRPQRRPILPEREAPPAWIGQAAWGVAAVCLVVALAGFGWEPLGIVPVSAAQRAALEQLRVVRAETDIHTLRRQVDTARLVTGQVPTSLETVAALGLGRHAPLRDPWNQPYRLRTDGPRLLVVSAGPDRRPGTGDDLGLEAR